MYTKIVQVPTEATDLKTLMESAGRVFPNDNDTCKKVTLQIKASTTNNVVVMSEDETDGFTLSNNATYGPVLISYMDFRVRNTYLKATGANTPVVVLIETVGG